jgi:cytochrome c556
MSKTLIAMLLSVLLLSACGGEPKDTRPGQPVAHRREAFKAILRVSEPMGVMLREDQYDATRFQALTQQLMSLRNGPWGYFAPDTLYPPSHAKPEVWSQADKFAADKKAFFDATDGLAAIAGTPDKIKAAVAYKAVEDSCRDCHKAFKTE